ncbi:MAG: hypothetical protein R3Y36_02120 [Spirochaetales bacterium]
MEYDWYKGEIFSHYGTIKRARGSYLYTAKGIRLVDMYQEGGRAILGWSNSSGKAMLMLKNTIDRGLTGSFVSDHMHRAKKAVFEITGVNPENHHIGFFASKEKTLRAIAHYSNSQIADADTEHLPLEQCLQNQNIPIWRAWGNETTLPGGILFVIPPFAWAKNIYICIFNTDKNKIITPSDDFAPCFFAALSRAFYDFQKRKNTRSESDWQIFDNVLSEYFTRTGPYLQFNDTAGNYKDFVIHCIEHGILLSPEKIIPSIVPFDVTGGDLKKLQRNPFRGHMDTV